MRQIDHSSTAYRLVLVWYDEDNHRSRLPHDDILQIDLLVPFVPTVGMKVILKRIKDSTILDELIIVDVVWWHVDAHFECHVRVDNNNLSHARQLAHFLEDGWIRV